MPNSSGTAKVKMLSSLKMMDTTQTIASAMQVVILVIMERPKLWLMDRLTSSGRDIFLP